jgi:hypothetical protein
MSAIHSEQDESCREISQRLAYLNRYVTIALALLIGATVLILQRIAEDRRQTQQHQAVKDDAVRAVEQAAEKLESVRSAFDRAILRANASRKALKHLSEDDLHVFKNAPDALLPKSGPAVQSALIGSATARLRSLAAADDGYRTAEIIFQELVAHAHEYIQLRTTRDAKIEALQAVSREKSFPSPFGDINLDPEVALAYLAILAAGAYLFLVAAKRRAMALVPDAKGTATVVPPAWLYTVDPGCRRVLGWRAGEEGSRLATALAVHLPWLALSLGLACATFITNAHRSIAFVPPFGVAAIIVAMNALALLACFEEFLPMSAGEMTTAGRIRRSLLGMLVASAAGAPLVFLLRPRGGQKPTAQPVAELPTQLVQNGKTGVLHHGRICRPHLAKARHLGAPVKDARTFHRGYEAAIVLAAAADVERQLRTAPKTTCQEAKKQQKPQLLAIAATLESTLEVHPLSWSVLDKLIRIYGRLKMYPEIAVAIDKSLDCAKNSATTDKGKRAIKTLESRKQRNEKRQLLNKNNPRCV